MSVRAYIIREKNIWVNETNMTFQYDNNGPDDLVKYTHTDEEYCINIWHQDKLIDLLIEYGAEDYTNQDLIGEIEMGKNDFESFCENYVETGLGELTNEDLESIDLIKAYFAEGNEWLIFKCY